MRHRSVIDSVKIIWPSGLVESHYDVIVDQTHQFTEGEGSDASACLYPVDNYDCEGNCIAGYYDCAGKCGGDAEFDCNDDCGGTAVVDNCGVCGGADGDVNGDDTVNILDVVQIVNYILGNLEFSESQVCSADLNISGGLNILDVVQIVNLILS